MPICWTQPSSVKRDIALRLPVEAALLLFLLQATSSALLLNFSFWKALCTPARAPQRIFHANCDAVGRRVPGFGFLVPQGCCRLTRYAN